LQGKLGERKLNLLLKKGINRLSMGVQSFNPTILNKAGRLEYTVKQVTNVIKLAREKGIETINLDFMQDLPGQSLEDIERDLETVANLRPESITWYRMRLSDRCVLKQADNQLSEMESLIAKIMVAQALAGYGYIQSSGDRFFLGNSKDVYKSARSNPRCNMLGLGVSAFSHFEEGVFKNETSISKYVETVSKGNLPLKTGRFYSPEEKIVADLVLSLKGDGVELGKPLRKLIEGKSSEADYPKAETKKIDLFERYRYIQKIRDLITYKLLEFKGNTLKLTFAGNLLENEICRQFYSSEIDALSTAGLNEKI
ncbi:MAG: radical SAM protein, partial [Candidatus Diapherotrites archaeon]|nr:radical SAM protein [Candidatus Diapherotrites archaeon]